MIKCEMCKKEFKNKQGLSVHLGIKHKDIRDQDYYDNYFLISNIEKSCDYCRADTSFIRLTKGYKKYCDSCSIHKKNRKEYWIIREGKTKKEAIECVKKFQTKDFSLRRFQERYGLEKGKEKYNEYKSNLRIHFKKINDKYGRTMSHRCVEYWTKRGYTQEEAKKEISKKQKALAGRIDHSSFYRPSQLEYWLEKGFSLEEAKQKHSSRQKTFSKEICIQKHGREKGLEIFQDRQDKWQTTLKNLPNYADIVIRRVKGSGLTYSKISQKLFDILKKELNLTNCNYATNNNEILIKTKDKIYFYDFECDKCIIEFNGDYWHANPKIFKPSDRPVKQKNISSAEIWGLDAVKNNIAINQGFKLLVVWESDFKENPNQVINECKQFIMENRIVKQTNTNNIKNS